MSEDHINLVKRTNFGKVGNPFKVKANLFSIQHNNTGTIHHYDITITPEVPSSINKQVFRAFELKNESNIKILNSITVIFDGAKNMFSPRALPFGKSFTDEIILPEVDGKPSKTPRIFKIKIMKVNEIPVDIEEMHQGTPSGLTAIMALNVLFRHQPDTSFVQIKNSFYIREDVHILSGGIEIWPGYFRSFTPVADGLALNVDTSICVFYRSGNLIEVLVNFIGLRDESELYDPKTSRFFNRFQSFLKGLKVLLSYRGEAPRDYKVRGLTPKGAQDCVFNEERDGEVRKLSVVRYIEEKYNLKVRFPHLPCIEVKRGVMIPMEFFSIPPGQRYMKKLDPRQTSDMIRATCIKPQARFKKILDGLYRMGFDKNKYINQFGLKVGTTCKEITARHLPSPMIEYHPSSKGHLFRPEFGSWNMIGKRLYQGMELKAWAVICYCDKNRMYLKNIERFVNTLVTVCNDTGMKILEHRPRIYYHNPNSRHFNEDLEQVYRQTQQYYKTTPQLMLCILPDTGSKLYGDIKTSCEMKLHMPTQCVQSRKVERPDKQYCANVCLKMNAKLGGINVQLGPRELNSLNGLSNPPTLILGADVTHPSPGNLEAPSIAAVIGSLDFTATRYASSIRLQSSRQEMITDLSAMIVELLKAFYKSTRTKPQRIIFYRDGVSNGQFQSVLLSEMRAVKVACAKLESGYKPKITFAIVQKRHHVRFIPSNKKDEDRSGNCKAGTLVEQGICHPTYFDFYLQSHSGLQGTARPCHYHVLIDENALGTDAFQSLSYNLCYVFNRATKSVSLVPPVYYAHLAAARARCHYKISDNLSDTASIISNQSDLEKGSGVGLEFSKCMYYI